MTRANCQQPDACVAGKRGPCRLCADLTAHAERGRERMRRLHQDPEFAAARDERMRRLNQDPEFAAANAERGRERMRRLHQDPEFAAARDERMRRLHQDPEFAAARDERGRERMRRLNQDPEFAAMMARYRRGHGIPIPDWVPDDLCADYADTAREQGEEAAAAHVRRLKREAA